MSTIDADAFDADAERFGPQDITTVRAEDANGWVVTLPDGRKLDVYNVRRLMHGAGAPSGMVSLFGVLIDQQGWCKQGAILSADTTLTIDLNHGCLA